MRDLIDASSTPGSRVAWVSFWTTPGIGVTVQLFFSVTTTSYRVPSESRLKLTGLGQRVTWPAPRRLGPEPRSYADTVPTSATRSGKGKTGNGGGGGCAHWPKVARITPVEAQLILSSFSFYGTSHCHCQTMLS